jgi:hypothetical protein
MHLKRTPALASRLIAQNMGSMGKIAQFQYTACPVINSMIYLQPAEFKAG